VEDYAMQGVLGIAAIREEGDFLGLANAFSALYPINREDKRLLNGKLLATPR